MTWKFLGIALFAVVGRNSEDLRNVLLAAVTPLSRQLNVPGCRVHQLDVSLLILLLEVLGERISVSGEACLFRLGWTSDNRMIWYRTPPIKSLQSPALKKFLKTELE